MDTHVINPKTNRKVKVGTTLYRKLVREGIIIVEHKDVTVDHKDVTVDHKDVTVDKKRGLKRKGKVTEEPEEECNGTGTTKGEEEVENESDLEETIAKELSQLKFSKPNVKKSVRKY